MSRTKNARLNDTLLNRVWVDVYKTACAAKGLSVFIRLYDDNGHEIPIDAPRPFPLPTHPDPRPRPAPNDPD